MELDAFETLVRGRRAVRHFDDRPLPAGLLERLLDIAHWAPSGYNLQPTHFLAVTRADLKERLFHACLEQAQIREAPAIVIFVGDRRAYPHNFERVLAAEQAAGSLTPEYERKLRQFVPLAFEHGPAGLGWLWKALLPPLGRLARPIPSIPAVQKRYWLAKQALLAAMVFMLAAEASGLATVPMEGFDEGRVRSILGVPRWCIVPVIVPIGYAAGPRPVKTRLPSADLLHRETW